MASNETITEGDTGQVAHTDGSTGQVSHTDSSTGQVVHTDGSTGQVAHTDGSTGQVSHTDSSTGQVTHTDSGKGHVAHTDSSTGQVAHTDSSDPFQAVGQKVRELTEEERQRLANDTRVVSEFKQNKLEAEAKKNWDLFYKRNTTKFFKDRHWTTREFHDLCGDRVCSDRLTVLEVGCGVGNFMFPLIQEDPSIYFYACDFSPRAVQFVKDNPLYSEEKCCAFVCDLTKGSLCDNIPANTVDVVSMIFVLSAIHPDKMLEALRNVYSVIKPGGCVLFRDYGLYDHAQLRFAPGNKLSDNFYVRQDGTRAYYFSTELLAQLFGGAGFSVSSNEYISRQTINKKEGLNVPRVFVQSKFVKPNNTGENGTAKS